MRVDGKGRITDDNSGLKSMIDKSNFGKRIVGVKLRFVPCGADGNPNWNDKAPPMQEAISIMRGMKGYEWLPGRGTLGRFPEMVSILSAIAENCRGQELRMS